jgi:glycosyltransferase involved in cell wall biosynthesis
VTTGASEGRYAYVTEVDISIDNGPGINEREFVAGLLSRHADEVVCVLPAPSRPQAFSDARIQYAPSHAGRWSSYGAYLAGSQRILRRLHDADPFAALVFRPGGTPLLPFMAARALKVPVILKKLGLYAIFGDDPTRSKTKNAISRGLRPMYRSVIQGAIAADVESHAYVDWLHEQFGINRDRMRVIPNGVNTRAFRTESVEAAREDLGLRRFTSLIGYVGALSRIRRVDTLIRAFGSLRPGPATGLVLVGSGSDRESLMAEARALGLGEQVVFAGSVDYTAVPRWISSFDVAVDPTAVRMRLERETRTASFSQKIGQYLSCGVPVVAWDCDDTRFLESEGVGRTAAFPSEEELGGALAGLLSLGTDAREAVRASARRVAEARFDSQMLADLRVRWWRELVPPS